MDKISQSLTSLGLDPVSVALASVSSLYRLKEELLDEFKTTLLKEAVIWHHENNAFFRTLCKEKNFHPDYIHSLDDLKHIPLIPIHLFKSSESHKLLSVNLNRIELEMRSTGTSGIPSVARRCRETVNHAVSGMYAMYREFFGLSSGAGLYLCPSTEEIPEMGMIKALNMLAGLLDTHRFMVRSEQMVPEHAFAQLKEWENRFDRHIIGPPFLIQRFIRYLKATDTRIQLDPESYIITLGGWKRFSGEMLSRAEFNQECIDYLGIEPTRIRDIYALVESNVLAIDDEYGEKHVSPYIHFSVRDPRQTDRELPVGEVGQLAILDPLSRSTPGFILTEDLVRLLPGESKSHRSGQRVQYVSRLPESKEFGCCAVNLDKRLDETEKITGGSCPIAFETPQAEEPSA